MDPIFSYDNETDKIMMNEIILPIKSIISLNKVISEQEEKHRQDRIEASLENEKNSKKINIDYLITIESFFNEYYKEWCDDVINGGKKPWITVKDINSNRYLVVYDKIDVCTIVSLN